MSNDNQKDANIVKDAMKTVKIGNEEEVFWTGVRDTCKKEINQSHKNIVIQEHVKVLAEQKIKESK